MNQLLLSIIILIGTSLVLGHSLSLDFQEQLSEGSTIVDPKNIGAAEPVQLDRSKRAIVTSYSDRCQGPLRFRDSFCTPIWINYNRRRPYHGRPLLRPFPPNLHSRPVIRPPRIPHFKPHPIPHARPHHVASHHVHVAAHHASGGHH